MFQILEFCIPILIKEMTVGTNKFNFGYLRLLFNKTCSSVRHYLHLHKPFLLRIPTPSASFF